MIRWLVGAIGLSIVASHAVAADPIEIGIGYLGQAGVKSKLALIEQPAENDGIAGARLAIDDNNTTGKFLNQRFSLQEVKLKEGAISLARCASRLAPLLSPSERSISASLAKTRGSSAELTEARVALASASRKAD